MPGALEGIRIVDFSQEILGPYSTALLADMGATVEKIERREGEFGRRGGAAYVTVLNRGKRSVTLDLKQPKAKEIVYKMVKRADVVVSNWIPGVMDRLGYGYEALRKIKPDIIYASGSTFGSEGPWAKKPGRDTLGQAAGGLMSVTGPVDGVPFPAGACIADATTGAMLASAILAALVYRGRTGKGQKVEVSLYGTVIAMQPWEITAKSFMPQIPVRRAGRNHSFALRGVWGSFATKDGYICLAGCFDEQWPMLCRILGIEAHQHDPLIATADGRNKNEEALWRIMEPALRKKTTDEWLQELEASEFLVSRVQTYDDILKSEQALLNGYIRTIEHPDLGKVKIVGHPIRMSATPPSPQGPAPEIGQHTEEVLLELGYSWEEIGKMQGDKVV
ncbi:MAG: CoA transferase [Chloroflexi bacterium]|nr:CoA transferase [Chloroflexota bacterium]